MYSIRSERMLMERISYNNEVWDHFAFSKNHDRLMAHDVIVGLFNEGGQTARVRGYLSGEHFSVDSTLSRDWTGHKSFVWKVNSDDDAPPDGGDGTHENWHGEQRRNDTHQSSTESQVRLFRKCRGTGAMLCYISHVLTDNRHGLVVNTQVTQANGIAERHTAADMLVDAAQFVGASIAVGAIKNYGMADFVGTYRAHGVTPHMA